MSQTKGYKMVVVVVDDDDVAVESIN